MGVGYRAALKGSDLEMQLGFSHPVLVQAPENITFEVPSQTEIIVSGPSKEQVGQVAANIRKWRKPEPYKGKGIRYEGERRAPQARQGREGRLTSGHLIEGIIMNKLQKKQAALARRHRRVRGKISGTAERPRLCVTRSNSNMYVQVIDDVTPHDHLRRVDARRLSSKRPARRVPPSREPPFWAGSSARRRKKPA